MRTKSYFHIERSDTMSRVRGNGWQRPLGRFMKVELIDLAIRTVGVECHPIWIHLHVGKARQTVDRFDVIGRHIEHPFRLGRVAGAQTRIGISKIPHFQCTGDEQRLRSMKEGGDEKNGTCQHMHTNTDCVHLEIPLPLHYAYLSRGRSCQWTASWRSTHACWLLQSSWTDMSTGDGIDWIQCSF